MRVLEKISKTNPLLLLILAISLLVRLNGLTGFSLSNDELSAMARLQFSSFSEMIEKGVRTNDMHPIGVQSFLWFWTQLTGISDPFEYPSKSDITVCGDGDMNTILNRICIAIQ